MSQTTQYSGRQSARQPQQHQQQQQSGGVRSQNAGQLPQQYRQSLDAVAQAVQVCGWCADKCVESANPNMVECIKLCEDVVEIGETVLALGPRSSRFTAELAQTFERAAQACARECGMHSDSHCQECASVLPQAARMVRQLSAQGAQSQQPSQQPTGQRSQQGSLQLQQRPQQSEQSRQAVHL